MKIVFFSIIEEIKKKRKAKKKIQTFHRTCIERVK